MDLVGQLHASLDERPTPEHIAGMVSALLAGRLTAPQKRVLHRSARTPHAAAMAGSDRPIAAVHKVRMLLRVFGLELSPDNVERMATDPWFLHGQLAFLGGFLGWMPGSRLEDARRLNRAERAALGIDTSRRVYNKRARQLRRTAEQAVRLQRQILLRQMLQIGRAGLAYSISEAEMRADPDTAAFVAYWTALRNLRRPPSGFDPIAQMLFSRCVTRVPAADWWMVARVYPAPEVLERLTERQRGELMGEHFAFLRLAATWLKDLAGGWPPMQFMRERLIVYPGMDVSTWNQVVHAYNQIRERWLACLAGSGALRLLNAVCPGKAMPLRDVIAGDDAVSDGAASPDHQVWELLPAPWDVVDGEVQCTARTVELACYQVGVDPRAAGWTVQPEVTTLWKPGPELVAGIEHADPGWAGLLRQSSVAAAAGGWQPATETVRAYLDESAQQ